MTDTRPSPLVTGQSVEQSAGVPASPSGCQPSASAASSTASSQSGIPNAVYATVDAWRSRPATDAELKAFVRLVDDNHCKDSSADRYDAQYRVQKFAERHARKLLTRLLPMTERAGPPLPGDVVRLVIAAREVAYGGYFDSACEHAQARLHELDNASEAFASRIPWDEEPASAIEAPSGVETAKTGSTGGESAVAKPDAQGGPHD